MSAYGAISTAGRPKEPLASTIWHTKVKDSQDAQTSPKYLTLHHLTLSTADKLPGLVSSLHKSFADELERGRTYPQEILQGDEYTQSAFESYFFAADAIVAIIGYDDSLFQSKPDGSVVTQTVEEAQSGRTWEESLAGVYYVGVTLQKCFFLRST